MHNKVELLAPAGNMERLKTRKRAASFSAKDTESSRSNMMESAP